ncbi:hypothetical protein DS079_12200 [Brachybacterium paraconglomeratum]|uniref:Glycoside hydrolase 35 catalytic domain-containing protein n=1 Tax=Brachybacterium paraconglomeratum TaxID=173362 RepID=A0A426SIQ0_9MICO|nr:hypothetical protein DS079_12200 [Brachybacterium paraconglomeratum]
MPAALTPTSEGLLRHGEPHMIVSGALHYFRVHPAQWRDRLRRPSRRSTSPPRSCAPAATRCCCWTSNVGRRASRSPSRTISDVPPTPTPPPRRADHRDFDP